MINIFARLNKNHKTIKSLTYKNVKEYESGDFFFHLSEICHKLDIPTPIVIEYHRKSYEEFNFVKFKEDDFVDKVNFDYLLIENVDF